MTAPKTERGKRTVLVTSLDRLDGWERRVLADLRTAGYKFRTIEAARRYRATLEAVEKFHADEDADALAEALKTKRRRAA